MYFESNGKMKKETEEEEKITEEKSSELEKFRSVQQGEEE